VFLLGCSPSPSWLPPFSQTLLLLGCSPSPSLLPPFSQTLLLLGCSPSPSWLPSFSLLLVVRCVVDPAHYLKSQGVFIFPIGPSDPVVSRFSALGTKSPPRLFFLETWRKGPGRVLFTFGHLEGQCTRG